MMFVKDICLAIESLAPLSLQETYDNAGLQIGDRDMELTGVLLCIDVTENVITEAISKHCNMIVSHHPLIFCGIKKLTDGSLVERCVRKTIENHIALYASHTNMDSVLGGVSSKMAEKLGLKNCKILHPISHHLLKLITFVPKANADEVRNAIFDVGAGCIGNYDSCSYNFDGEGTFRAREGANPFVGKIDELHTEPEVRIEIILPDYLLHRVEKVLVSIHPYEEPAYDFIPIVNDWKQAGFGIVGDLEHEEDELHFLRRVKSIFEVETIRHTKFLSKKVRRVAVCGGSGVDILQDAITENAQIYVSADFKYHDFFLADNSIVIADIGHFESEQYTKDVFFEQLRRKFPKFAVHLSEVKTNPINYL